MTAREPSFFVDARSVRGWHGRRTLPFGGIADKEGTELPKRRKKATRSAHPLAEIRRQRGLGACNFGNTSR